jgi:hypothetical protein
MVRVLEEGGRTLDWRARSMGVRILYRTGCRSKTWLRCSLKQSGRYLSSAAKSSQEQLGRNPKRTRQPQTLITPMTGDVPRVDRTLRVFAALSPISPHIQSLNGHFLSRTFYLHIQRGGLFESLHSFLTPAKMPSETSDIKQFLEIARRKDAKCEFWENLSIPRPSR